MGGSSNGYWAEVDGLRELVMKLGDRILACAEILGRVAEKRRAKSLHPHDVCKQCHARREEHTLAEVGNNPLLRCPNACSVTREDFFYPASNAAESGLDHGGGAYAAINKALVAGVGRDAPVVVNEVGGRQSGTLYRCDLLPSRAVLAVAAVLKEGAEKYGDDNWRKIPISDHVNHALIHILARQAGDASDDHLEHAACRLLMALDLAIAG